MREASSPGEIHLGMEWSFQEIEKEAQVYLLYRAECEEDWTKVTADHVEGTTFQAPVVLLPDETYQYQVIAEGSALRASETTAIPAVYYRIPPLEMISSGGSQRNGRWLHFEAHFSQREPVLFDFYKVRTAKAKIYRDDGTSDTVELESIDDDYYAGYDYYAGKEVLGFDVKMDNSITSISIEVVHEDGTMYEGEIWPDPEKYDPEHTLHASTRRGTKSSTGSIH